MTFRHTNQQEVPIFSKSNRVSVHRFRVQRSGLRTRAKLKTQNSRDKCWFCHIFAREMPGFRLEMIKANASLRKLFQNGVQEPDETLNLWTLNLWTRERLPNRNAKWASSRHPNKKRAPFSKSGVPFFDPRACAIGQMTIKGNSLIFMQFSYLSESGGI